MLMLSRLMGEEIKITVPPSQETQEIVIRVVEIRNKVKARLGFTADKSVVIMRTELLEK